MITNKYLLKYILLLVGATLLCGQTAMAEVEVDFDIQPRVLRLGENAQCTLTVRGAKNPPHPRFPDQDEFRIRAAGTNKRTEINNFKATTSIVFSYVLTPLKTGTITIGPYTYHVDGEEIQLPAIELKVVSGSSGKQTQNEEDLSLREMLFARFELPAGKIYSQQVFPLVLEIFAQKGLNVTGNFEPYGFPESGINLGQFRNLGERRTTIDGRVYTVFRFATAAQALSAGEYEFQPGLRAGMRVNRRRRSRSPFGDSVFGSFFDMGQVERVDVPMDPLSLTIEPIPSTNMPSSFSGAVGEFAFKARAEPKELNAGEPITVTMTVEGRGNIDSITAPKLDLGDKFKTYEPGLISSDQNGALGNARKIFEQVVIPRTSEIEELPAIEFSYFDPESGDFGTIQEGPFPLTVHESSNKVVQISANHDKGGTKSEPEILGSDIVYLKEPPATERKSYPLAAATRPVFWLVQSIPLLAIGGLLFWKRRREFLAGNVAVARRQKAPKAARAALQRAEEALQAGNRHAFFESLWEAAADYFGHRLNLAPGEIDTERGLRFCRAGKLPEDMVARLETMMVRCEQERFASMASGEPGTGSEEKEMLEDMRKILKRCQKVKYQSGGAMPVVLAVSALTLIGIALFSFAGQDKGASISRRFAKAAEHYDAGRLDAALDEYRSLLDQGYRSEALYFNCGNAYFRRRDFGRAVLFYRRAWYMDPNDPDVNANMELAVREAGALTPELTIPMRLITRMSGNQWLAIAVAFYWLSAILLAGYLVSSRYRGAFLRTLYAALFALAVGLGGVLGWVSLRKSPEAVVVEPEQEALFAPIADSTAHFALPPGSIVEVVDESDGWLQIASDDKRGWIPGTACERTVEY